MQFKQENDWDVSRENFPKVLYCNVIFYQENKISNFYDLMF